MDKSNKNYGDNSISVNANKIEVHGNLDVDIHQEKYQKDTPVEPKCSYKPLKLNMTSFGLVGIIGLIANICTIFFGIYNFFTSPDNTPTLFDGVIALGKHYWIVLIVIIFFALFLCIILKWNSLRVHGYNKPWLVDNKKLYKIVPKSCPVCGGKMRIMDYPNELIFQCKRNHNHKFKVDYTTLHPNS